MEKPYVIGFYGYSDSGKTTLIESLIRELTSRGKRVAAIKQSEHKVGMDTPGKDTYRYTQAGANPVVLSSTVETDIKITASLELKKIIEILNFFHKPDFIIVESASDAEIKKIRVGEIKLRENTLFTYDGNFEKLIKLIINGGQ